jgi:hypothetical protein
MTFGCELRWLGPCSGPLDRHHILNRAKLMRVRGAMEYCQEHKEVLLADVCRHHDADTKLADTAAARAYLIRKRVSLFGEEYVRDVLDGLRALCKSEMPDWRLEAILAARSKTPPGRPPESPAPQKTPST